ncbi:MAG TPA: LysM peptidoglycan-binding domain-containing protein [Gemmatimonadaceae bacterium]|nr:LysM peptidoglycan-binding domain-containing protein [Gemmatimonadaceae bacterium]
MADARKKGPDFSDVRGGSSSAAQGGGAGGGQQDTYTVQAGDSLSKIAQRRYGEASKWKAIYEANKDQIKNPDLIHPGQVLRMPKG